MNKKEIIEFMNRKYGHIDLNSIAKERTGNTNALSVELARYVVETDKLNIFLVATNARKRAPVYLSISNSIKRSLGISSIKTNVTLSKITGFCSDVITKKSYTFNLSKEERLLFKLNGAKPSKYFLEGKKYNTAVEMLESKNYIKHTLNGNKTSYYIMKEGQGKIDEILGKLFGYPSCCINAFIQGNMKFSSGIRQINKFASSNIPEYIKYGLNKDFLPYVKCSSKCKASKNLAKHIHEYIKLVNAI